MVQPTAIKVLLHKNAQKIIFNTEEKIDSSIKNIKGMVGSIGKVRGKVKIIMHPREYKEFKKGDILVTGMTTPDFIPLMQKASAIVTDEGGITCHAAIVSRELGIPCVIGTKIATKILKNNEEIIVDAYKGMIQKLD